MVDVSRFDVLMVSLNPTVGKEIQKTRPCLVISPDDMNKSRLNTIIVAPMTTTFRGNFPTRVDIEFQWKQGQVALDQIRTIDRERIVKRIGNIKTSSVQDEVLRILQTMFS